MARTIAQIQSQIMTQIAANSVLGSQLTSPSQVAIYNVFAYIVATALSIEEQLRDIFQTEITTDLAAASPNSPLWLQNMVKQFQYNAASPQVVTLNSDFTVSYPVINTAYNVVANCAVVTNPNKVVLIKVAPAIPTQVFDNTIGTSGLTMQALTSYLDLINAAGVEIQIINAYPDLLGVGATIYYDGQYASTIQAAVNTAINNYVASLPFNGLVTLFGSANNPGLYDAIAAVAGVDDVVFNNVAIRPWNFNINNATKMVLSNQIIYRNQGTYSGRAIIDTSTGSPYTLSFSVSS